MGVGLPNVRIGLAVALFVCYCYYFRPSPSGVDGDSVLSDHPVSDHGTHKPSDADPDPASQNFDQGTPPPPDVSTKQAPEQQTMILTTTDPERVKDDNIRAVNQGSLGAGGFFNGASNMIFNQPVMTYVNEAKDKVLQWLVKYTMSNAEFDASGHVPGCHPGTRITILEILLRQVGSPVRRMVWLRGPAGVGKSAILQSLAEQLSGTSSLGATLFFSRSNRRHNPDFVIPTIAYQLAVRIPPYKEHVQRIMINNPKLLEKDVERQFQALIVEPFTKLGLTAEGGGWVILLDGLDECQGEIAQVLFVNLISRFTRQHPSAPLVWVIASRPEAHLQGAFDSEEVRGSFEEHEVVADSDDACRDVEKYLRAKFMEMRRHYKDLMPVDAPWPAEQDIARISRTSSGLFALATTITHYVDDPDACDPISQLATVLSVTEGLEPGSLSALYGFYSAILAGVPKTMLPVVKLLLTCYSMVGAIYDHGNGGSYPLVVAATIFGLQQHTVYGALRRLHSVIKVPPISESGRRGIMFYHASFPDYLKTLEDDIFDVGGMKRYWWGLLAFLHGGDSTAYLSAVSDGRPPVPLSWNVQIADIVELWWIGIPSLLHFLLPQCPNIGGCLTTFGHPHLFSDTKELQNALDKINFSALILAESENESKFTLHVIYNLFKWLVNTAPPETCQSDAVKKFCMRDLDLSCISKEKFGFKFEWIYHGNDVVAMLSRIYGPQHLRLEDRGDRPIELLISKLDRLSSENPAMDVLVVGKGTSRRCVLICIEPTDDEHGAFYYVPYCG